MNQHPNKNINNIRYAFWGTPEVSRQTLDKLFNASYVPTVIITSKDTRSGRGMHITESPVSIWAKENKIECLKPDKLDKDFTDQLKKYNLDLSIVIAYGKILREEIIKIPRLGTLNIHYSLLPKNRGASPVEESLLNGDKSTGVSLQQMRFELDSGPIICDEILDIDIKDTKKELLAKLTNLGANLLIRELPNIMSGNINPKQQLEKDATFCTKIKKENGEIDISGDGWLNYNKYRAFYGWPGVYFFSLKNGKKIRVKIMKAKYENNSFIIERVIPENKKEMSYEDFIKY